MTDSLFQFCDLLSHHFFFFFFSIYIASTNGLQKQGFNPSCFSIDDSILNFNQYG